MSSPIVNLENLTVNGQTVLVTPEYTDNSVVASYNASMAIISAFFNSQPQTIGVSPLTSQVLGPVTAIDPTTNVPYTSWTLAIENAMTNLTNLSNQGITVGGATFRITYGMGIAINQMAQTLNAVGFDFTSTSAPANIDFTNPQNQALMQWQDLASAGLLPIIQNAALQGPNAIVLQGMIAVDYIDNANTIISNTLNQLQQEITVNQQVVNTLADLQALHNQISIIDKSLPPSLARFTTSPYSAALLANSTGNPASTYTASYKALTSSLFGTPIVPVIDTDPTTPGIQGLNTPTGQGILNQFVNLRTQLSNEIAQLTQANPTAAAQSGSLVSQLQACLNDMSPKDDSGNPIPSTNLTAQVTEWLLDGQGDPNNPNQNAIQQNIVNATNTAGTTNSTQQQLLNSELFLLQEFYQSASAMISDIDQTVKKIADGSGAA